MVLLFLHEQEGRQRPEREGDAAELSGSALMLGFVWLAAEIGHPVELCWPCIAHRVGLVDQKRLRTVLPNAPPDTAEVFQLGRLGVRVRKSTIDDAPGVWTRRDEPYTSE